MNVNAFLMQLYHAKARFVNEKGVYEKMIFIKFKGTERKYNYETQYDEAGYELV